MWVRARIPSLSPARVTKDLALTMREQMFAHAPLMGPVALRCQITLTRHRRGLFATRPPSLFELATCIERGLTGIVFNTPTQIVSLSVQKGYGDAPGVEVTIERVTANDPQQRQDGSSGAHGEPSPLEVWPDGA